MGEFPDLFARKIAIATLLMIIFHRPSASFPIPIKNNKDAASFLGNFGYMNYDPETDTVFTHEELVEALKKFQTFVGLNETGRLDNSTIDKMGQPRCGVKDLELKWNSRQRRYSVHGSRWRKRHLTYSISKYSERLTRKEVDEVIRHALLTWSSVTTLTFSEKPHGPVDIDIRFEQGEHGDGKNSSFDGPGGSLAHAFFPAFGGAAHFDDAETWSLSDEGTNLYSVATHELGHSLGLHHTDVLEAVMSPYYQYNDFGLHSDDVGGIQAIYGKTHTHEHGIPFPMGYHNYYTPEPSQELNDCPDLCEDPAIDAIFTTVFMKTYIFKGDYYWQLVNGKLIHWHPRKINQTWIGLPGNIDAAFTYGDGRTYFFKGSKYWSYIGHMKEPGFPKNISEELSGVPNDLDAALVFQGNRKLYFFKGSEFWRYDPNNSATPKAISSNWGGIPNDLDASYTAPDGSTYFIKGNSFYKFDNHLFEVEEADPPFPRNLTDFVYECWKNDY